MCYGLCGVNHQDFSHIFSSSFATSIYCRTTAKNKAKEFPMQEGHIRWSLVGVRRGSEKLEKTWPKLGEGGPVNRR